VRVLVVADDAEVRTQLAARLAGQAGFTVEQALPEDDLASAARGGDPDVILWDLGDGGGGTTPADLLGIPGLAAPVVVLGNHEGRIAEAVAAGARGALRREAGAAQMRAAVQAAREGLVVIDPAFAGTVAPAVFGPARGDAPEGPADELTRREQEVLSLLAEGFGNKQIAKRLGISEHTVNAHVDAILGKLDAHSRTEAVTRAARLGLIVL